MPRVFDSTAERDVVNQINTFTKAGESFTALHVTNGVRNAGMYAGTFGHLDGVAPAVRNLFDNRDSCFANYHQSLVDINGRSVYVYHPASDDPYAISSQLSCSPVPRVSLSNFQSNTVSQPNTQVASSGQTATYPTAKDLYGGGADATNGDVCLVFFNSDGDAQLPRAMTRALGLNNGDGVMVEGASMSGVCNLRAARDGETPFARLQVANGALRLRDSKLMPFGVGNADSLTVTLDTTSGTIQMS